MILLFQFLDTGSAGIRCRSNVHAFLETVRSAPLIRLQNNNQRLQ